MDFLKLALHKCLILLQGKMKRSNFWELNYRWEEPQDPAFPLFHLNLTGYHLCVYTASQTKFRPRSKDWNKLCFVRGAEKGAEQWKQHGESPCLRSQGFDGPQSTITAVWKVCCASLALSPAQRKEHCKPVKINCRGTMVVLWLRSQIKLCRCWRDDEKGLGPFAYRWGEVVVSCVPQRPRHHRYAKCSSSKCCP